MSLIFWRSCLSPSRSMISCCWASLFSLCHGFLFQKSVLRRGTNPNLFRFTSAIACITDKVREARLRWFGHVQRREEKDCVRRILEADVCGQRSKGRRRKRWIDVVKYNMEDLRVDLIDVENRAEWRRRTRVADPSPEGSKPLWKRERSTIAMGRYSQELSEPKMHLISLFFFPDPFTNPKPIPNS